MRVGTWALLVAASGLSVASGQLRVALVLAAVKAAAVGLEFMELRHAARAHLLAYLSFVALVTGGLLLSL